MQDQAVHCSGTSSITMIIQPCRPLLPHPFYKIHWISLSQLFVTYTRKKFKGTRQGTTTCRFLSRFNTILTLIWPFLLIGTQSWNTLPTAPLEYFHQKHDSSRRWIAITTFLSAIRAIIVGQIVIMQYKTKEYMKCHYFHKITRSDLLIFMSSSSEGFPQTHLLFLLFHGNVPDEQGQRFKIQYCSITGIFSCSEEVFRFSRRLKKRGGVHLRYQCSCQVHQHQDRQAEVWKRERQG